VTSVPHLIQLYITSYLDSISLSAKKIFAAYVITNWDLSDTIQKKNGKYVGNYVNYVGTK